MTILEEFVSFAKDLPDGRLKDVEAALLTIMSSYGDNESLLTPEQEAENHRRFAQASRTYAKTSDVEKLLGRKLPS